MKKQVVLGLFLLTSIFLSLGFVSSATDIATQAGDVATAGVGIVQEVSSAIFVPLFGSSFLLPRIFMLLIIFLLVYSIVPGIFGDKTILNFAVSAAISILAMVGIPPEFIESLLVNYGVMGSTILVAIPFLIILVFSVRVRSQLAGRFVWLAYAVFYFITYFYKWISSESMWNSAVLLPFLAAMVLGVLMFFVLGAIRAALFKGEMDAIKESGKAIVGKAKLLHKLQSEELKGVYGDTDTAKN